MNDIHFSLMKISGYRGRNFTLKMNPRGQHTVFIMDGNTGKTTTIELLRWCFRHPQSEAIDKFEHMWNKPAHVLDDTKKGHQIGEITIQFTALDDANHEHFFQFKRVTEGEFDQKHLPEEIGDKITSISDMLEIDHGSEVLTGDEVYLYVAREFRFNECAEYFCFDGEKARQIMQLTSDSGKIEILLDMVNRRTTHPRLEEYKEQLSRLRERVLAEARAKITDKALQISMGKLNGKIRQLGQANKDLMETKREIDYHSLALKQLKSRFEQIQDQITIAKAKKLIDRNKYELEQKSLTNKLVEKRSLIYNAPLKWFFTDGMAPINQFKTQVKEKGKLPEPYRQDLIQNCLGRKICEICGRPLDKKSEERIKRLGRQVAPHAVHVFLSSDFSIPTAAFDPKTQYSDIKELIEEHRNLDTKIKSIKLSEKDAQLVAERHSLDSQMTALRKKIAGLNADADALKELIVIIGKEVKDLQQKNAALAENKIILDKIEESIKIIDATAEKIKLRATDIISKVIAEGISSILGPKFSAKLSLKGGLMLGEDGFYGREKGGYSGRLILSYCFAEAMTLVEPIIIDTPVGNIGGQREPLANHLVANHKQVVLLCLPTEIQNFAPIMSKNSVVIENLEK